MMIVRHLFRNENKLCDNLMFVLYPFVFFVQKPAARSENQNVYPGVYIVSRLNSCTSIKKVWDMVRKIQGKGKSASVNYLKKNDNSANTLADSFSKNSSSENYTSKFRNIKNQQEKTEIEK